MSEPKAIKIQGCTNKYTLINGTYERLPTDHHGKPAYVTRAAQPCYIFHSGKARWVISKRLDDGSRCYAFLKDDCDPPSNDLTKCKGSWVMCGDDNQWAEEKSISACAAAPSNDVFVQIRLKLEDEMNKLGLTDTNALKQLWRRLDINGNNVVSLAEVDKLVVEMTAGGAWPTWLNNKPALMRAFQHAKCGSDGKRDDFVEKCEFHDLLLNIFWFNKIYQVFEEVDSDDDRRIDVNEFRNGLDKMGLKLSSADAQKEFQTIDSNHGGEVLFVEFCAWIRKRVNPDDNPAFDTDIISGEKAGQTLRKKHGSCITHSHYVNKKNLKSFDDLEEKIRKTINDIPTLKKMWTAIDFNGNNIVSLAEIDKWVVENYPILNHKPALMRAYHKTFEDGHEKDEFVSSISTSSSGFSDAVDEDHDRRLTCDEFKWCLSAAGIKQSEARATQVQKQCPEALTEFCDLDSGPSGSHPNASQTPEGRSPVRSSPDGRAPQMYNNGRSQGMYNDSPEGRSQGRGGRSQGMYNDSPDDGRSQAINYR
eukprot:CAMPEP_0169409972 /NCGR_PEP_ID=MMETSP1017-20121227/59532_1 /TAXON_ID=342587 /ORGANISM="Karlodinium micrum, Strain CCMP2283" /LENGTH=533 /DNA_ID=CAMNT_0009517205 /DNA_START=40 /DNA_END=1640 /DNA_ORIENTATION=-